LTEQEIRKMIAPLISVSGSFIAAGVTGAIAIGLAIAGRSKK
jgi:hypothetical protein